MARRWTLRQPRGRYRAVAQGLHECADRESILLCRDDSLLMAWQRMRAGWPHSVHTRAGERLRREDAIDHEQVRRSDTLGEKDDSAGSFNLREVTSVMSTSDATKSFAGKIALVAGATRGAGRGIATMLGTSAATVICTAR